MQISMGKLWSLRRLAGRDGKFTMIAVDQRPGVEALVRDRGGAGSEWERIGRLKQILIEELSPVASAMLVDPQYALPYAARSLDPAKGLLVTLEQFQSEEGPGGGRKTLPYPGWSVAAIKRLGADGVKLMLWYRPDAAPEVLRHQQELVERVGRECRAHDIAFLLEPLVYPLGGSAGGDTYHEDPGKRPELVIETVREFRQERYGIDIFKLETPITASSIPDPDDGSPEAAETQRHYKALDDLLDRPWVMLSAGAGMEPFRRILTYAFRAGASGYLAGRAIWWPATAAFPDWEKFRARVRTEGIPYVERVQAVLREQGRPWWAAKRFAGGFALEGAGPEFYRHYASAF